MKKTVLFCFVFLAAYFAKAQYCGGSGTGVCTPAATTGTPGLTPTPDNLPCFVKGTAVSQKIDFENFTTVSGMTVQWLQIDSIGNLPPGLCWKTNSSNNRFNGGQTGCILVTGTPTVSSNSGQYQLRIFVSVNVGFVINNVDAATQGMRYFVRLKQCANAACPAIDTANQASVYFKPYTALPTATASISPTTPINTCAYPVTLSANSGTGFTYKWSNGNTTQNATITTPGTYTLTVYGACGDSATATKTVTNGSITANISPNTASSICPGGSLILTGSTTAPSPTYQWYKNGTIISGAISSAYNATAAGFYQVKITSGQCSDFSDSVQVTVSTVGTAPINISATDTTFCPGNSVTLNATAGFTHYLWSNGDTTASITVSVAGSYSVAGQVTIAGCNSYGVDTITVSLKPHITAPILSPASPSITIGSTTTLSISNHTYSNYMWSNGATSPTISVTNCGTYKVTVFDNATCGYDSATVTISNSNLDCSIRDSVAGGYLYTATTGGSSYIWYNATTNTAVSTNPVFYAPTVAGNYYLVMTKNNCQCTSNTVSVNVGINDVSGDVNTLFIQPNPVNEKMILKIDIAKESEYDIAVYNLLGKKVFSLPNVLLQKGENTIADINVNTISAGMYILTIENKSGIAKTRFIKQ